MAGVPTSSIEFLIEAASAARTHAHAPFSRFTVGAALEDENGRVFTGCNIESATYGLTICAERVAVFKAISEGTAKIRCLLVLADTEALTPPCGACRQILWEFCGGAELVLANVKGRHERLTVAEIFPKPFDASFL